MKELKLVLITDTTPFDILDNITKECKAILVDEDMNWIEVLEDGFGVNDGWDFKKTKDITEAVGFLEIFIKDNLHISN